MNIEQFQRQISYVDCIPACFATILKHLGLDYNYESLLTMIDNDAGTSLATFESYASKFNLNTHFYKLTKLNRRRLINILNELSYPVMSVCGAKMPHCFIIDSTSHETINIIDPVKGIMKFTVKEFLQYYKLNTESLILVIVERKLSKIND